MWPSVGPLPARVRLVCCPSTLLQLLLPAGDTTDHFPEIGKIRYEGPDSTNPLSFRHYNPDETVEGKSMRDHLRFAVAYWHTFRGTGSDPFGPGTMQRPWEDGTDSV